MIICQKLYENGYITYMRTDSINYSKEFIDKSKKYISKNYGDEYINERLSTNIQDNTEDSNICIEKQNAHEAIRPTDINITDIVDTFDNKNCIKIYKLIWKNTIESCMSPATYSSIISHITAPQQKIYKYSCEQIIFPGWKIIEGYDISNPIFNFLKTIKNNNEIIYKKITSKETLKNLKSHYTEAKLVKLLEEKGIGRPSTFSSLIDKIQQRGYVKLENIKGKNIICKDFELSNDEITETITEKIFGNENNKLVIKELGIIVLNFLTTNYEKLFNYDYTKYMEDVLDIISKGDKVWYDLCSECDSMINNLSMDFISNIERNSNKLDKKSSLILNKRLGEYQGKPLFLKKGKYGLYVVWGDNSKSVNKIDKLPDLINIDDIVNYLNQQIEVPINLNIIKTLNNNLSIRSGNYGDYIYYKTKLMTKPKFFDLKSYKGIYKDTDDSKVDVNNLLSWIKKTYKIKI